jgi:hypothetical protein
MGKLHYVGWVGVDNYHNLGSLLLRIPKPFWGCRGPMEHSYWIEAEVCVYDRAAAPIGARELRATDNSRKRQILEHE